MSYYMRIEAKDGSLIAGMELESFDADRKASCIERYALYPGEKIKLYDLGNPTQTIEVQNANTSSNGADGTQPRDEADGQVRSDE